MRPTTETVRRFAPTRFAATALAERLLLAQDPGDDEPTAGKQDQD